MKQRCIASLLCLCIMAALMSAMPPARAEEDTVIDLIGSTALIYQCGGSFQRQIDRILANNQSTGNASLISGIRLEPGQHVRLEATAIIKEGSAFGLIIAESAPSNPFKTGWFCVNADLSYGTSRLMGYGGGNAESELGSDRVSLPLPAEVTTGVPVTLSMEILPDNTILTSCNGIEYSKGEVSFAGYGGGYPGIMTYHGDVEFLSATLSFVGTPPQPGRAAAIEATHLAIAHSFVYTNDERSSFETLESGRLIARNLNLDAALNVSCLDIIPGEHIMLDAQGIVMEGEAFGLLIQENKGPSALGSGLICLVADVRHKRCLLFSSPSTAAAVADSALTGSLIRSTVAELTDESLTTGQEIRLWLELLPDGTLRAGCNEQSFAPDVMRCWEGFNGGAPGIMTFRSDTEFVSCTMIRRYHALDAE